MLKNIKQYFVFSQITSIDEQYLQTSTNRKIRNSVNYLDKIRKILHFYNFFNSVIIILHIPYLFFFCKNYSYSYYKKYFLLSKGNIFKNYFFTKYTNLNSQLSNKYK